MIPRTLFILRRRWAVLIALVAVGVVAGLVVGGRGSSGQAPRFTADALVSVNQAAANQTEVQQALIEARQGAVAAEVATELGSSTSQVTGGIAASFDPESYVATITATAADRDGAQALIEAFTDTFVAGGNGGATADQQALLEEASATRDAAQADLDAFRAANADALAAEVPDAALVAQEQALEVTVDGAEAAVADQISRQRPTDVYETISIGTARAATPGKLDFFADPIFRMGLGLVLGLVAAAIVIAVAERTNPRIDDPETAADLVGAPVLAMVPRLPRRRRRLIERADPQDFRGPYAEAFRSLRSHLDFRSAAEQRPSPPRIMVTSAAPSEGKSTTTAFLALAYAESDTAPVVVGGDLRRPSIHRIFGVDRVPGLTSRSLPGGRDVPLTSIVRRDPVTGVTLIPSGPSVDSVADVTRDLRAVTEVAQQSGQVVLLDTAPVRVANDALDFLPAVDWVVVAVQAGSSTQRGVRQTVEVLRRNGAVIVGVVVTGAAEAADASRDYYAYYAPESRPRRARRGERATDTVDLSDDQLLDHDPTVAVEDRPTVGV